MITTQDGGGALQVTDVIGAFSHGSWALDVEGSVLNCLFSRLYSGDANSLFNLFLIKFKREEEFNMRTFF